MALELRKAVRRKAFLKLGMSAPSGGGKTAGALLVAFGIMKGKYPKISDVDIWEKIAIIDSENKSGELYVNSTIGNTRIGEYLAVPLESPFTAEKYIDALKLCEDNGVEVAIIDSTTHLWAGEGGMLEQQGNAAKRTGNSYTAWRDVTPQHNRFIEKMLQANMHIIATMRSKTEHVQEKNEQGKTVVRKVGMNPIQRDGMEYEFTAFFEIDAEHNSFGAKDRTQIYDQKTFKITPDVGRAYWEWLDSGADVSVPSQSVAKIDQYENKNEVSNLEKVLKLYATLKEAGKKDEAMEILREKEPAGNPKKMNDEELAYVLPKLEKLNNN